jgi:perosamine synthetase
VKCDRRPLVATQPRGAQQALAIEGGRPVRESMLPYARHTIDADDETAVLAALRSDWLTTGPRVAEFEQAFAAAVGARHAVAVSSGTAALHAAVHALDLKPGDEVIVPALTFAATANAVLYCSGVPVFADVDPDTLLVDPAHVASLVTPRTRAILAVDYAGQPCDYEALRTIASRHGVALLADACHSLGARARGHAVGSLADMTAFSLHPAKVITAGEGGVATTDDSQTAERLRAFRNHGFSLDREQREQAGSWQYDQSELGYNYRLTDVQCALAASQLRKLPAWIARRREIAGRYRDALADIPAFEPLMIRPNVQHAWHLFVVRLHAECWTADRDAVFRALRAEGIGVQVHYRPVYLHTFYEHRFGSRRGLSPAAEAAYNQILSLPIFPSMSDADVDDVLMALSKVANRYSLAYEAAP